MTSHLSSRDHFYINGQWVAPSSDRRFTLINASTEAELGSTPEAVDADVDRAVAAARDAFDKGPWGRSTPAERVEVMNRFVAALAARSGEIARAVSAQNGMPVAISETFEGQLPLGLMQFYASLAESVAAEEERPSQMGKQTWVGRKAMGVVAAIVPWNFPVTLAFSKIAPAMAAGCTVVIKPSPGTILDSYLIADAAHEAGVPAGVLNWVPADREAGAYLVSHPGVDKVAFTGSTGAGRAIARACGELLRPVTLELGGKSAAIILDDVDLNALVAGLPTTSLFNNGQTCYSCTRILAPQSRYGEVVEALAAMAQGLKVGDSLDPGTQIGPMASALHRDRVLGMIKKGRSEGRIVTGGGKPKGQDKGWFVEPTIFADVSNKTHIAREEIFGPVLTVIPYRDEADAVQIANDSIYGLGGSVWSQDVARARAVADQVQTGTIGINGYVPSVGAPFGGIKASGLGRELGPETLSSYLQYKSTYVMG